MQRWSFNLQIYFLNSRIPAGDENRQSGKTLCRTAPSTKTPLFSLPTWHAMGLMTTRDFTTTTLFNLMNTFITPPDLLIYLRAVCPPWCSRSRTRTGLRKFHPPGLPQAPE
jgi:deoxyadenosine/deoxycytidine kinase